MQNTLEKLRTQQPVTIVVTGDSCAVDTHWTMGRKNWVQYLAEALWAMYGDGFITVINASKCGNSYATELQRMDYALLRFKPDLVLSAIGGINADKGPDVLKQEQANAREFFRRVREAGAEAMVMTNNPVVFGFWKPLPEGAPSGDAFTTYPGRSEASAMALKQLAEELGIPVADIYSAWKNNHIPFKHLTAHPQNLMMWIADTVHPGPIGHLAIFRVLAPFFKVSPYFPWEAVPFVNYPE